MKNTTSFLVSFLIITIFSARVQAQWSQNGTSVYYNDGNVGIGVNAPSRKLDLRTNNESLFTVASFSNSVNGLTALNKGTAITLGYSPFEYYTKIATIFENNNPNYISPAIAFFTMHNSYLAGTEVERMRISSNGNVGIGTTTPNAGLEVAAGMRLIYNSTQNAFGYQFTPTADHHYMNLQYMANNNAYSNIMSFHYTGKVGIGTQTPNSQLNVVQRSLGRIAHFSEHSDAVIDNGESFISIGYSPLNIGSHYSYSGSYGFIEMNGGTRALSFFSNGNVGIGTSNPGIYKLAVEGVIGAREVKVTTDSWADFVFKPNYNLRSLSEVEQFIKTNNHLPEIPSEAEVKENGIGLGEMNAKLLQKVEELTLYLIEQDKKIQQLEQKIETIKSKQ